MGPERSVGVYAGAGPPARVTRDLVTLADRHPLALGGPAVRDAWLAALAAPLARPTPPTPCNPAS